MFFPYISFPTLYIKKNYTVDVIKATDSQYTATWSNSSYTIAPLPQNDPSVMYAINNAIFKYLLDSVIPKISSEIFLPIDGFYMRGENGQTLSIK